MIGNADTVGVFQIESRAQMSMLPRLRPNCFYDLVIEVAIVRPGPIQGNMVHPYLRRRAGQEPVEYPSEALREVLQKTLGVPLFQEQAMKVAMVAAGFSAEEADKLRRAMAAWRRSGALESFHCRFVEGMLGNGYTAEFAEQCFQQIKGFGEYGFPESHAASFALLVYVSAWLKRHHPAVFACALLNSQPMGFYAPAQIVRDAKEHGVEVRRVDVNESEWDCTLERHEGMKARRHEVRVKGEREECRRDKTRHWSLDALSRPSCLRAFVPSCLWGYKGPRVRLGFRQIKGLREDHANVIVAIRKRHGRFTSIEQFHRLTALPVHAIRRLAEADAFGSLGLTRREAVWQVLPLRDEEMPLFEIADCRLPIADLESEEPEARSQKPESQIGNRQSAIENQQPLLPPMPLPQEVLTDYATTGLSLKKHPVALVRRRLDERHVITAEQLRHTPPGRWVKVAGLVLIRQRPSTANGIVFETLEDETGVANLILRPDVFDRYPAAAREAWLLQADGYVERQGQVIHVMVKRLEDLTDWLEGYRHKSRDFQ